MAPNSNGSLSYARTCFRVPLEPAEGGETTESNCLCNTLIKIILREKFFYLSEVILDLQSEFKVNFPMYRFPLPYM